MSNASPHQPQSASRRKLLKQLGLGSLVATSGVATAGIIPLGSSSLKGNINHSVCSWTYGFLSLSQLCDIVRSIGIGAIDLVKPADFAILKEKNIDC